MPANRRNVAISAEAGDRLGMLAARLTIHQGKRVTQTQALEAALAVGIAADDAALAAHLGEAARSGATDAPR